MRLISLLLSLAAVLPPVVSQKPACTIVNIGCSECDSHLECYPDMDPGDELYPIVAKYLNSTYTPGDSKAFCQPSGNGYRTMYGDQPCCNGGAVDVYEPDPFCPVIGETLCKGGEGIKLSNFATYTFCVYNEGVTLISSEGKCEGNNEICSCDVYGDNDGLSFCTCNENPFSPSTTPTSTPTFEPSSNPIFAPFSTPTKAPTSLPSSKPSSLPTHSPTHAPTLIPTSFPSKNTSLQPTISLTSSPTFEMSSNPTFAPCSNSTKAHSHSCNILSIGCSECGTQLECYPDMDPCDELYPILKNYLTSAYTDSKSFCQPSGNGYRTMYGDQSCYNDGAVDVYEPDPFCPVIGETLCKGGEGIKLSNFATYTFCVYNDGVTLLSSEGKCEGNNEICSCDVDGDNDGLSFCTCNENPFSPSTTPTSTPTFEPSSTPVYRGTQSKGKGGKSTKSSKGSKGTKSKGKGGKGSKSSKGMKSKVK